MAEEKNMTVAIEEKTEAAAPKTENQYLLKLNHPYACILAGMATGLPEEFFTGLPLYEVLKIKNAVNDAGFFE